MKNNLKTKIEKALGELVKSEKVTKKKLSELSRDMLYYVPETQDIGMVNRLLAVLTPNNYKVASIYFNKFLEWKHEKDGTFSTKIKGEKTLLDYVVRRREWLSDESNDIWVYADQHITIEKKPTDYVKNITRNVAKALNDETNPLTAMQVMEAVIAGGVTAKDLIVAMGEIRKVEQIQKEQEEQLKKLEAA